MKIIPKCLFTSLTFSSTARKWKNSSPAYVPDIISKLYLPHQSTSETGFESVKAFNFSPLPPPPDVYQGDTNLSYLNKIPLTRNHPTHTPNERKNFTAANNKYVYNRVSSFWKIVYIFRPKRKNRNANKWNKRPVYEAEKHILLY